MHEELDGVVWVSPILVLVCCNLQDPHAAYQYYEEVPMWGNPTVCNFCRIFFPVGWVEASSVGGWVVYREEGGKSWGLYSFSPDVLYPCWYEFIILYPCGDDAVKIIHYFLFPESEFPEGNFALFWTWPECTRQKYIIICKLVVALTYHCLRMSTSHNFRTNNSRRTLWNF